jgi:ribosomal protein S18 acetylase RimI-like enzyme
VITYRLLDRDDAPLYKQSRLNALRLAPTAFSSSYETSKKQPDKTFQQRVAYDPESFVLAAFENGAPGPNNGAQEFNKSAGELKSGTGKTVSSKQDTLIGMAGGYVDTELKRRHIGYVVGMWVEPAYRRQGIARRLLRDVVAQLRTLPTITTIQLSVTAGNASAQSLYEDCGFTCWGTEPQALCHNGQFFDELHFSLAV